MAQKKITDLSLRDSVSDDVNFPVDDGIQSYRVTAAQILSYCFPTGIVTPFAGTTAPPGFLLCNGQAVSRSEYAALYAVIGVTHGNGDGVTTFNVPDYRGRFLRGVDGGAGRDPDRASRTAMNGGGNTGDAVGSLQGDSTKRPTTNLTGTAASNGAHTHDTGAYRNYTPVTGSMTGASGSRGRYTSAETSSLAVPTTSNGAHTHSVTITGGGDSETRPKNANVNYIIKV